MSRIDSAAGAVQEAATVEPPVSPSSNDAPVIDEVETDLYVPNRLPDAPDPVTRAQKISNINAYIHRRRSNASVHTTLYNGSGYPLDPPPCHAQQTCPYCTGPYMTQRFMLMERLHQLNHLLYGKDRADDLLKICEILYIMPFFIVF